jgi:hypothetical protein
MSKKAFGAINQNAFVVADIDVAIEHWTRVMRVGPFFKFPKIEFVRGDFRGKPCLPEFDAAIAYTGDLMIELIRPQGPSIFKEFLEAGGKGVHHFAAFADDMAAAAAQIQAGGGVRVQGGTLPDGSSIAYFEMGGPEPSILEIACLQPGALGLFAAIKAAGAGWDGTTKLLTL